jgi:hypothetical protein
VAHSQKLVVEKSLTNFLASSGGAPIWRGTIEPTRSLSDPLPFLLSQGPLENSAIRAQVGKRLRTGGVAEAVKLDMQMTSALNPITSAVIKDCLPGGQRRPFPKNTMSLMTITGAKGSMVSCSAGFAHTHFVGSRTSFARIGFCPEEVGSGCR